VPLILEQEPQKLVLKEQGYGAHSAKALAKILKHNEQLTTLDISMNNINLNLDALIGGLRQNDRIVSLKMRNNNIDGRKSSQQLYDLVFNHQSLASVDLGNSENIKNRNRIYDEGLEALVEGMA
jgi:Ran GTPase-activating protein (RanGAP) involved in mRNA processing and transport